MEGEQRSSPPVHGYSIVSSVRRELNFLPVGLSSYERLRRDILLCPRNSGLAGERGLLAKMDQRSREFGLDTFLGLYNVSRKNGNDSYREELGMG